MLTFRIASRWIVLPLDTAKLSVSGFLQCLDQALTAWFLADYTHWFHLGIFLHLGFSCCVRIAHADYFLFECTCSLVYLTYSVLFSHCQIFCCQYYTSSPVYCAWSSVLPNKDCYWVWPSSLKVCSLIWIRIKEGFVVDDLIIENWKRIFEWYLNVLKIWQGFIEVKFWILEKKRIHWLCLYYSEDRCYCMHFVQMIHFASAVEVYWPSEECCSVFSSDVLAYAMFSSPSFSWALVLLKSDYSSKQRSAILHAFTVPLFGVQHLDSQYPGGGYEGCNCKEFAFPMLLWLCKLIHICAPLLPPCVS